MVLASLGSAAIPVIFPLTLLKAASGAGPMGVHSFERSGMLGTKAGAVLRSQGTGIGLHGVTCRGGSLNACAIAGLASACGKIPPVTDAKTIATGKAAAFDRTVRTLLCMIILLSEGWLKFNSKHPAISWARDFFCCRIDQNV